MILTSLLYFLGIFLVLAMFGEIFRRYPKFALGFFAIIPIVLFSCWLLLVGVEDWFPWVKVFSITLGILVVSLFRTTKLGSVRFWQWLIYIFLAINILEAVVRDVVGGSTANYFNAFAGILLVLTLDKINTIQVKGKYKDLHWGSMTLPWILGYTLWNWTFVYLNYGFQGSIQHLGVLGAALVVGLFNKERWLQTRAFTLGMYFVLFHTVPHYSTYPLLTYGPSEKFGFLMSVLAAGFMAVLAIFFYRRKRRERALKQ